MAPNTLMRIGYCGNGAAYLETRFPDGSFPEVYTLDGDCLDDLELADTFRPVGKPVELCLPERIDCTSRDPHWEAASLSLLESLDDESEEGHQP
jgi:hypothetical protein